MKRFLLLLGLILCINTISFAAFPDVSFYSKEINYLSNKGIINGYEDGLFRPEEKITRAELVKMVVTATKPSKSKDSYFTDLASDHWAKEYINKAVASGLIVGDPEGTFRPEDNITYGEVSAILVRALGKEDTAEKLGLPWPQNYMQEAKYLNLFDGYRTNDLIAENEARRDSVALMVYNMLNYEEDSKTLEEIKIDTKTAYAGFVTKKVKRNGEPYITVVDNSDTEFSCVVKEKYGVPEKDSFIIYQLTSDEEMQLRKELTIDDIDESFITVEFAEQEIIKLAGQSKLLDLDLDKYTLDGKTYKLNKMNFFIIELDLDENEFTDYELYNKEDLKLKKYDKIKFDDTLNVCLVIRIEE